MTYMISEPRIGTGDGVDMSRITGKRPTMTDAQLEPQASIQLDDSGGGLSMFLIFTAAVLIVTAAVAVVALVGTWWMLGVAFAIHVLMTTAVVVTIVSVMNGRAGGTADRTPAERRRVEGRPTTRREWVAAL